MVLVCAKLTVTMLRCSQWFCLQGLEFDCLHSLLSSILCFCFRLSSLLCFIILCYSHSLVLSSPVLSVCQSCNLVTLCYSCLLPGYFRFLPHQNTSDIKTAQLGVDPCLRLEFWFSDFSSNLVASSDCLIVYDWRLPVT